MNKKLKKIAIVGATTLIAASSLGFSNAMQVKKTCNLKKNDKVYICLNGNIKKLDFKCISMFDILKWFDKNNCLDKFPSTDDDEEENDNIEGNDQNTGNDNLGDNNQNNNQGGNIEDNNQDKEDNNQDSNNNQDQDKEDNNQEQDKEDNNNNSTDTNSFSKEQLEVLNLVNKEREANGLKPLTLNKELSNVANIKSRDMIEKGYFDHNSPTYGSPFDMMKKFNISYKTAGENIAMGQKTPSEVMNSWMNSSGHRANILNSSYTELGVGIQKDSNGRIYWTQMFIGK